MTNDILDELRRFRPEVDDLDHRWPADSRAKLADRIRHDEVGATRPLRHRPRSRRGRLIAASTLVAAAVAVGLAVPSLLPAGAPGAASPAAAAALHRLARVAANTPVDIAGPDQFVHTIVRERQVGDFTGGGKATTLVTTYESWTAADGRLWRRQTVPGEPDATTEFLPASDGTTSYIASLPTDADDLNRYLRKHTSGSNSTDEAVFVAIGDVLRGETAPAALRSAAVAVLARTNHVILGHATKDQFGRVVQEFDFVDNSNRPGVVEALYFDPYTAQLTDERTTAPGSSNTSSLMLSNVVDSVPPEILRTAIPQK